MRIIFKVVLVSMSTIKTAEFSRVASTSEIPPGIMRKVTVDGQDVVLANVDGKYFAIGGVCTHQAGPLDEGILTTMRSRAHGTGPGSTCGRARLRRARPTTRNTRRKSR